MTVHVGPVREAHLSVQAELVRALEGLGYDVSVEPVTDTTGVFEALDAGRMQLGVFDWAQGILAPSTFFDEFRCGNESRVCEPSLDRLIEEAIELQSSDAAAAADKWSEADRALVDLAFWAPLYHSGADLVSRRVDNVQFHPAYLLLLDQLWVR